MLIRLLARRIVVGGGCCLAPSVVSFVCANAQIPQPAAAASAASAPAPAASAPSAAASSAKATAAASLSDYGRLNGDRLEFRTTTKGFVELDDSTKKCAPAKSQFSVKADDLADQNISGNFLKVGDPALCKGNNSTVVETDTLYVISKSDLGAHQFTRTGFTFGALVVPFKFRFGDNELVSSSTVAPYVGWRLGYLQKSGVTFTPVLSSGLALVPVSDSQTGKSETKSALSFATGFVVGSTKNEQFQAGILFGVDVANKSDREKDPGLKKPWASFYIGYSGSAK